MRKAQAQDWIEDLIEFGPNAVADACREWRRTASRRPTPAEIRKLCIEAATRQQERQQIAAPVDMDEYARSVGFASAADRMDAIRRNNEHKRAVNRRLDMAAFGEPLGEDMAAAGRKISAKWAQQQGYKDIRDYMAQNGLNFDDDHDYGEACKRVAVSLLASEQMPGHAKGINKKHMASELGVKAREYTADELRAGRIALGIERPEAAE